MDNGALVFIIAIEAIVIVWLASKLKQFQRFEQILDSPTSTRRNTQAASSGERQSADPDTALVGGNSANQSSAASASAAVAAALQGSEAADAEVLDMPGVDPEANIEEAKRVQLVMARCRYAEFYLEQLDDEYEQGQFQQIVNSCKHTARNIADPFFKSSALQPLIMLLDKAGWEDQRDQLLTEVSDELIRQSIDSELAALPES